MKPKILGLQITTALFLHIFIFILVMHTYCTGSVTVLLQPFYPVYTIKPFYCEYTQASQVLPLIDNKTVLTVYSSFRDNIVKTYVKRVPPFEEVLIKKDNYGSFKTSGYKQYQFGLFLTTTREPVKNVISTRTGDCDDFSTLLYIIYKLEGYDSHILLLTLKNKITGQVIHHEVVVVKYDNTYYLFDSVNDFISVGNNVDNLLNNYQNELMYFRITQYWFFDDRLLMHKNI